MDAVLISGLCKTYAGGNRALAGVDLRVSAGEHVTVVGPSGSGKSTLLRLIAGLDRPTEGRIEIGGRSMEGVAPHRRGVAMVFQDDALFGHLSVRANIALSARSSGVSKRDVAARTAEAAEALGISALLDRRPGRLSGGERRRASLAGVIVRRASVVLLDEPLASLDESARHAGREQLRLLRERFGMTLIHVTHDQEEALALGTRVAVLVGGVLHQFGTPREVWDAPGTPAVLRAVGGADPTFLRVRCGSDDRGLWIGEGKDEGGVGWRVRVPVERAVGVPGDGELLLGVRSTSWRLVSGGAIRSECESGGAVPITVLRVEWIGGAHRVVGVTPGGQNLTARLSSNAGLESGGRAMLGVEWDGAWLFGRSGIEGGHPSEKPRTAGA